MIYWKLNNFLSIFKNGSRIAGIGDINVLVYNQNHIGGAPSLGLGFLHLTVFLQILLTLRGLEVGIHFYKSLR